MYLFQSMTKLRFRLVNLKGDSPGLRPERHASGSVPLLVPAPVNPTVQKQANASTKIGSALAEKITVFRIFMLVT